MSGVGGFYRHIQIHVIEIAAYLDNKRFGCNPIVYRKGINKRMLAEFSLAAAPNEPPWNEFRIRASWQLQPEKTPQKSLLELPLRDPGDCSQVESRCH